MIFVTLVPNFNFALSHTQLLSFLKVQIHLIRAHPTAYSVAATFHYQMVIVCKKHALDLNFHNGNEEVRFISMQNDQAFPHSCLQENS